MDKVTYVSLEKFQVVIRTEDGKELIINRPLFKQILRGIQENKIATLNLGGCISCKEKQNPQKLMRSPLVRKSK